MVMAITTLSTHLGAGCFLQRKKLRFTGIVSSPWRVGFPLKQYPRGVRLKVSSEYNCLQVQGLSYRAPGTQHNLLNQVTFSLPEKSLGLVYGRSGSGKTTLLQVLGGLAKPTEGSIFIQKFGLDRQTNQPPEILSAASVGIVFQFPERHRSQCTSRLDESTEKRKEHPEEKIHYDFYSTKTFLTLLQRYFLADTVVGELTFGWPRQLENQLWRQQLSMRLHEAILAVRMPDILLLDEPLAGLDWKARADVISLLKNMKKERILIVVSHDLKEISPLVDKAWRMDMGGFLKEEPLFI